MNEIFMTKQSKVISGICCMVVFFFISGIFIPACSAQICTAQSSEMEPLKKSSQNKMSQSNYDDNESFFNFAIIWGTFEERVSYFPFLHLIVSNPSPWYNRTMHVIGYQNWVPKWVFKTSYELYCDFNIGIVGFHRLFVIAYGNIAAF
jgi:hypothetical protein